MVPVNFIKQLYSVIIKNYLLSKHASLNVSVILEYSNIVFDVTAAKFSKGIPLIPIMIFT